MINPRFVESKSNSLTNEWLTFARLHALMFWKHKILLSWVPTQKTYYLKKTLLRENGLGEGWPQETYEINDSVFAATYRDVLSINGSFAVFQHPALRALEIINSLAEDRDNCSKTWSEMTGRDWKNLTFKQVIQELKNRHDLLIASHWWCPQEYCLLLHVDSYSRIFKAEDIDGIAWWLGERGIQATREDSPKPEIPSGHDLENEPEWVNTQLGEVLNRTSRAGEAWKRLLDAETYELIQCIYTEDSKIYASA